MECSTDCGDIAYADSSSPTLIELEQQPLTVNQLAEWLQYYWKVQRQ
ncbi:hypothetical protein O9992_06790 [Vibrio lentus]|nr:hypothetical protein [Vibrio lentus]